MPFEGINFQATTPGLNQGRYFRYLKNSPCTCLSPDSPWRVHAQIVQKSWGLLAQSYVATSTKQAQSVRRGVEPWLRLTLHHCNLLIRIVIGISMMIDDSMNKRYVHTRYARRAVQSIKIREMTDVSCIGMNHDIVYQCP